MHTSTRITTLLLLLVLARIPRLAGQTPRPDPYPPLPAPLFTLGSESTPELEFQAVSAAHRLPGGNILVADARSPVIRIFGPQGQLVRIFGREGAGPGEYRAIHSVYVTGDTLIVYDWHQRRLTRLRPDGTVLGTQLVEPAAGGPVDLAGRLGDGRWLVTTIHAPSWSHGHGAYRDTVRAGILDAGTVGRVRWLPASYPGMSLFAYMPSESKEQWVVGMLPLAATTITRAMGDTIYVADTGTPDLLRWRGTGAALAPLRLPLPPPPDLQPLLDAQRDEELAKPGAARARAYILAKHEVKRTRPRYRDFLVAASGDLWIRLYERSAADSTRYLVTTPEAVPRAHVSLPARSRVIAVEPPLVFVEVLNEDDVATLSVIRWTPP